MNIAQPSVATQTTFEILTCPECCILFAVTQQQFQIRHGTDDSIYCPNGHELTWDPEEETPSDVKPVETPLTTAEKKELQRLRRQVTQLLHEREQAEGRDQTAAPG